jgi:hypothetical protein
MLKEEKIRLPLWTMLVGLLVAGTVIGVSVVRARQTQEVGEAVRQEEGVVEEASEATEGGVLAVDYYLSYPGILPDHPLYWLKMVRDRVQLWLTTKPLVKAERLLLYADKRLGAGWALVDGNKVDLGVTTLTKGEKYLERVMIAAESLGEGGEEMRFKEKLNKARMKHEEVLLLLEEKLGDEYKEVMEQILQISRGGEEMMRDEGEAENGEEEALEEEALEDEAEELEQELQDLETETEELGE